ncbi:MAG: spermidine synthase, partial [Planctomycetota bacterium]
TYLVGLSLGALLVKPWIDRVRNTFRLLGLIEIGIGITALLSIPLLPRFLGTLYWPLEEALQRWGLPGWTAVRFVICFFFVLVPTSFMGATMPVVSRIYVRAMGGLGRKMGVIGCLDTVGSILGSFAGGFVMIPLLGIQRTIIVTALVNLALAAWMFWVDPYARRRVALRPGFLVSVAALLVAPFLLLSRPQPLSGLSRLVRQLAPHGQLLYYEEDAESSVTVFEEFELVRYLFVNQSIATVTSRLDLPGHEMIAHVPLLLHPDPKRALLIGFGAGFTTRACRVHGVEVDVVELSPAVRGANRYFAHLNGDVLSDPKVHLRIDDGRNYVLGTDRRYDMIQAGIIHPAVSSGNAGFYTTDFYRECRRILNPNGVMCQWLPLHGIPVEDFKMLIRSFQAAFPYTSVWYKHTADFCTLIGTMEPLKIDFQDVERRVGQPDIAAHLARSDVVDVYDLLDSFCFADESVREAVGEGLLHTDDHPYIEFHCNRPVPRAAPASNVAALARGRERVWPRLANLPPERQAAVGKQLERWFRSTGYLIQGEGIAKVLSTIQQPCPAYSGLIEQMQTAFQRVFMLNPKDRNAVFLWKKNQIGHELTQARWSMLADRRDEALAHLARAASIAPGTYGSATARFIYEQETGRLPD